MYTRPRVRERLSPGGLRGLQIRRGALEMSLVGSTPMRSRQLGLLVGDSFVTVASRYFFSVQMFKESQSIFPAGFEHVPYFKPGLLHPVP